MKLDLNENQLLVQKTISQVVQKAIIPNASETDKTGSFPWENLKKLAAADLFGINIPTQFGGIGADRLSFVLATEEIARACASTALIFVAHSFVSQGILIAGTEEQKRKYLPLLAKGEKLGAFAVHEPNSGCIHTAIETQSVLEGNHYLVNGSKFMVTSGGKADVYLVLAVTDKTKGAEGISMFIIEKDTVGFKSGNPYNKMGLNGASNSDLFFQDCRVPKQNLIGKEGDGLKILGAIVQHFIMFGAAAISLGIAQSALESSIKYAKERFISKIPIGANQAIQFLIAEMAVKTESAKAFLYSAATNKNTEGLDALKVKLFASEIAVEVADKALQIHGGHGYCRDFPIERYYRDARGLTLHFNTTELLKTNIGKNLINS